MSKLARDNRNRELGKIHIAKQQLTARGVFSTDEDYRQMLWTQARVHSSADLDHAGRAKVLDHLVRLGFKPTNGKGPKRPTPARDKRALCSRIRAQLISLGRLPDSYADGISKQMFGVDRFEWCDHEQLHKITAALTYEQQRKGAPTA